MSSIQLLLQGTQKIFILTTPPAKPHLPTVSTEQSWVRGTSPHTNTNTLIMFFWKPSGLVRERFYLSQPYQELHTGSRQRETLSFRSWSLIAKSKAPSLRSYSLRLLKFALWKSASLPPRFYRNKRSNLLKILSFTFNEVETRRREWLRSVARDGCALY